ncbi:MAG: formate dehydrogenase accessory sulfurtransferase FdhD [Phycisphaerae bacterium]|nr:formate dehydrogenase accessory sulfurtransferase FdhD [Tepidisphaeraceae bacterium]
MPVDDDPTPARLTRVTRWEASSDPIDADDLLATEEPLEIRVRGRGISVTMRTPGHDDELAAGFLAGEGLVRRPADVLRVTPCARNEAGNVVDVLLAPDVAVDLAALTRHVFASSSCGLCGRATVDAIRTRLPPVTADWTIPASTIAALPAVMRDLQATFDRTGGLHAAALFDTAGQLVVLREDVGRHNAVDKVIGHRLLAGAWPLDRHVLLVSGRTSFEIVQKALAAGIPLVAGVSAPTSLAADFARESGQTLIGFLREGRMNVYSHPRRLRFS